MSSSPVLSSASACMASARFTSLSLPSSRYYFSGLLLSGPFQCIIGFFQRLPAYLCTLAFPGTLVVVIPLSTIATLSRLTLKSSRLLVVLNFAKLSHSFTHHEILAQCLLEDIGDALLQALASILRPPASSEWPLW
jgi:hypothetical protein